MIFFDIVRGIFHQGYIEKNNPIEMVEGLKRDDSPEIYFDAHEND